MFRATLTFDERDTMWVRSQFAPASALTTWRFEELYNFEGKQDIKCASRLIAEGPSKEGMCRELFRLTQYCWEEGKIVPTSREVSEILFADESWDGIHSY